MNYDQLLQLYFNRSNILFGYWTLYVVVIGCILAFSTLRQRRSVIKTILIAIFYIAFAYKNCVGIGNVLHERAAIAGAIRQLPIATIGGSAEVYLRLNLEPLLSPVPYETARRFHVTIDVLTVAALWGIERRRRLDSTAH